MPFPPAAPFVPVTTSVPILGPSSGNPQSLNDPNSLASIGGNLQAMTDQVKADTLYDTKKREGFLGHIDTGLLGVSPSLSAVVAGLILGGITLIIQSTR